MSPRKLTRLPSRSDGICPKCKAPGPSWTTARDGRRKCQWKTGKEVDKQLSTVLGSLGSSGNGSTENASMHDQFQGSLTQLTAGKGSWEKEVAKAQDLAARLEVKSNQALKDKGKELEQWVQNEQKEIKLLRAYLAAGDGLELKDFSGQSMLDAAKE